MSPVYTAQTSPGSTRVSFCSVNTANPGSTRVSFCSVNTANPGSTRVSFCSVNTANPGSTRVRLEKCRVNTTWDSSNPGRTWVRPGLVCAV